MTDSTAALRPRIDAARLFASLEESARVGALVGGGVRRLCLSAEDIELRRLVTGWFIDAGLEVRRDGVGNLFARRPGTEDALEPVVIGSHLDSQIEAGPYDGPLGVLAGLEVLRALAEAGVRTRRPLEIAVWLGEEGARFAPPIIGSSVWAGAVELATALATRDAAGVSVAEALAADDLRGVTATGAPQAFAAYFELHIEQGPVLDREGIDLGIVDGVSPARGRLFEVRGASGHAGPLPMADRRNAAVAAAAIALEVDRLGRQRPARRSTVTRLEAWPGLSGIVPSTATLGVDYRSDSVEDADAIGAALQQAIAAIEREHGVDVATVSGWDFGDDIAFDPALGALVAAAADAEGVPCRRMRSFAGHDAYLVARTCPAALLFVPCVGGVTHNRAEAIEQARVAPAVQVLLDAVLQKADDPE